MARRPSATIRLTVSYESNQIKIYAFDEHTGRSVAEVLQSEDPRCKDLEAVKRSLCESLKGGKYETRRRNISTREVLPRVSPDASAA